MSKPVRSSHQLMELLINFILRDIKIRYRGSLLGLFWVVFYPLSMTLIAAYVLSVIIKLNTEGVPYYLFAMIGIISWNFFTQSVQAGTRSLTLNRELVANSNFPKILLVISANVAKSVDLCINLIIFFVVLIVINNVPVNIFSILIFLILIFFQIILQIAISLITSGLNVYFRDIQNGIDIILQVLFYLTPVIYPVSLVPNKIKTLLFFNPLSLLIELYRKILFGQAFSFQEILFVVLISSIMLIISLIFFQKTESGFADVI